MLLNKQDSILLAKTSICATFILYSAHQLTVTVQYRPKTALILKRPIIISMFLTESFLVSWRSELCIALLQTGEVYTLPGLGPAHFGECYLHLQCSKQRCSTRVHSLIKSLNQTQMWAKSVTLVLSLKWISMETPASYWFPILLSRSK